MDVVASTLVRANIERGCPVSKHDDDFEFDALLSTMPEEEESEAEGELTEEQKADIQKIESSGLKFVRAEQNYLRFREEGKSQTFVNRRRFFVTTENLQVVADHISRFQECETYSGVVSADGSQVEYLLQMPATYIRVGRVVERHQWDYSRATCGHEFVPHLVRSGSREHSSGFHLTSPSGDVCIELSRMTPIASFMVSNGRYMKGDDYTLKVMVSSPAGREAKLNVAQAVADSLLFELDVKFGLPISLVPRERVPVQGRPRRLLRQKHLSFPSTSIPREVAALFAFAAEASDNPPFAFLSYYQVLEYYMPLTSRRDALKRIRREMRDFSFDISNDASVLRVLNAAERAKGLSEEDALKILVRDCVREDKLKEFFGSDDFADHFSRKGPIIGVPAVNLNATNESVQVQAAKRVYALRNRIVHAKDDPKYAETPQLLPRSAEANSLSPDVMLARFLALETIADTQD